MMTVRCYLAPSAIEALGVFAAEPIARGAVAWRLDPILDQTIPEEVLPPQQPAYSNAAVRQHPIAINIEMKADAALPPPPLVG